MGTSFKHFFKQKVPLGRGGNLVKCLPGKEGEAT